MAPNADRLRNRRTGGGGGGAGAADHDVFLMDDDSTAVGGNHNNDDETTISTAVETRTSLESLKGTEVCIDGVVYDIADFPHPGGESILIFGGNDVTVQYKMIHPYHTEKHLQKMKQVAVLKDYQCEFSFGSEFERELKREVFKIVHRGREFGTFGWYLRAFCYVGLYFYLQYLWLTQGTSWQLAIVYGISQAFIGLNVQHDANHGAASKKPWINNLFGLGADFIGGSKWLWMQQHWTHHSFTNHGEKDPDAHGAEPFFLFHDYPKGHPARQFFHRFQVFYFIFVLAGYWISEMTNPAIWDLKQRGALSAGMKMDNDYTVKSRKYARLLRAYYMFVHIVAPFLKQGLKWSVFGNIMLLGASSSLTLAVLFALSHNFEGANRDPTLLYTQEDTKKTDSDNNNNNNKQVDWYKMQVETSCTYGGFISGCLTGGLNFQVEHHLFPRMSSAWYPFIAPKVREICQKHNVKYAYYPWVFQNMVSTIKYMNAAGTGDHWVNQSPYSGKL